MVLWGLERGQFQRVRATSVSWAGGGTSGSLCPFLGSALSEREPTSLTPGVYSAAEIDSHMTCIL